MERPTTAAAITLLITLLITIHSTGRAQPSPHRSTPTDTLILERSTPRERALSGREIHAYQVRLQSGEFLRATVDQRGVDVVVRVFAPDGEKLEEIDSPNGTNGPEPIVLEAKQSGLYRLEVGALEDTAHQGRYEIRIEELLSAAQLAGRKAEERARIESIVGWVRQNAIPLKSVTAGSGFADLEPLKKILKDVRIVGLGEATHGSREFFQFKHRMVEFLVREMGFRVFALEASYAACYNINEYVMGRADDGAKALESQGFWTWNTEEVRAMLDWMRAYNASVPSDRKVKFVGYDLQVNERAHEVVLAYLRKVAPERVAAFAALPPPSPTINAAVEPTLEGLVAGILGNSDTGKAEAMARLTDIRARYNELLGFLVLNEKRLARASSAAEFADALQHARLIAQYLESYAGDPTRLFTSRDDYMAENIERLMRGEPAGTRMIVWAHNGHISAGDEEGRYPHMGWHLRKTFADEYYALGFSFNRGSFQSRDRDPNASKPLALTRFTVGPADEGSIDWIFAQTGIPNFIIDFRSTRKTKTVDQWIAAPSRTRSIGSMYANGPERIWYAPLTITEEFDGLVFFDTVSRARPNPSVKNVIIDN
jgi:erythromycin esterase